MSSKAHDRFLWAAEVLAIKPTDQLLEIGCGTGGLATLIARDLTTGTLTAIDRSESMIRQARKQNSELISTQKVSFLQTDFSQVELSASFDKIYAFNVRELWQNKTGTLDRVKQLLKPNGQLFVFYQPPNDTARALAEAAVSSLAKAGFRVQQVLHKSLLPAPAFCIQLTHF